MIGNTSHITLPAAVARHRLGVMHCCWGRLDFAEHCRLSAVAGASYVEDFAWNLTPDRLDPVAAAAARAAAGVDLLTVIAEHLDCSDPAAAAERLRRVIPGWRAIGLSTIVVLRSGQEHGFDAFLRTVEACAAVVRSAGLVPVSQNHVKGRVESPQELLRCREAGVDLHFDTQQFQMCGHAPLAAWGLLGAHVRHVHLGERDATGAAVAFGDGVVGMAELLRRMHAGGYRGAMTIETEYGPGDAGTLPMVRQAHGFVRGVLEPLGAVSTAVPGHAVVHADGLPGHAAAWGGLRWIAGDGVFAGSGQTVGLVTIRPGCANPRHAHPADQEVLYVRRGTCLHECGDRSVRLRAGDVLFIPPGQPHRAVNDGPEDLDMVVCYPTGNRSFTAIGGEGE